MARLSEVVDYLQDIPKHRKSELRGKFAWLESVAASVGGEISKAVGSINVPTEVPKGGVFIGIFKTSCPSGWSRVTGLDDRTLMGATSYGTTGGSATPSMPSHTHEVTGGSHHHSYTYRASTDVQVDAGTTYGIAFKYDNNTGDTSHTHTVSNTASGTTNWPPYKKVVFCSRD